RTIDILLIFCFDGGTDKLDTLVKAISDDGNINIPQIVEKNEKGVRKRVEEIVADVVCSHHDAERNIHLFGAMSDQSIERSNYSACRSKYEHYATASQSVNAAVCAGNCGNMNKSLEMRT
ncbi:hypothetical protein PENTCL1PPCAC_3120, partial [Pristionchus entomophagus]